MPRWRLDIRYDGTDFHGWAAQPGLRTVEGVVTEWLGKVLRQPVALPLTCAGRTDAGVHARGQVCHVDVPETCEPPEVAERRLARVLPADIVASRVSIAPPGFDSRFSALWRRYRYRVWDDPRLVDPLTLRGSAVWRRPLDVDAINHASKQLLGLRDFAAFCKPRDGASTIRKLLDCEANRLPSGMVVFHVRADAFCHSMVRSLVGALVAVGSGQRDADWLASLLDLDTRANDVTVLPASGLTLEEVGYPAAEELASRAEQARQVRTLS